MSTGEQAQEKHYDRIASAYNAHYSDRYSQQYAARFIHKPMFRGVTLRGTRVLDALCGSGQCTAYLHDQGAVVTGLDVSGEQIAAYQAQWPQATAIKASVLESGLPDESFDCVAVVGGLHHVHPHVVETITEFHRLLKPGGYLCFAEPHRGSLPDMARRFWYRHDSMFEKNEAAIDLAALKKTFADRFEFRHEFYRGQLAYLVVFNSLIFRIPLGLKRFYSPPLLLVERILTPVMPRWLCCYAVCQWRKL
jgi:SAM-dependent methyltransferase